MTKEKGRVIAVIYLNLDKSKFHQKQSLFSKLAKNVTLRIPKNNRRKKLK